MKKQVADYITDNGHEFQNVYHGNRIFYGNFSGAFATVLATNKKFLSLDQAKSRSKSSSPFLHREGEFCKILRGS